MGFFPESSLDILSRDGDFRAISKSVFDVELFFQQLVEALDDVVHDGLGCVVNAAQFSQLRIVSVQKRFIEMDNRITAAIARTKVSKNRVDVCVAKRLDDVLDESCERFVVQFVAGDLFKEISQKRICARNEFPRILAC